MNAQSGMPGKGNAYGLIAEFETPADTMHAAEKVRDAGFTRWDVYTPYPVHGMDRAMGLKNSKVGWFAFLGGTSGYALGMLMFPLVLLGDRGGGGDACFIVMEASPEHATRDDDARAPNDRSGS